tara:strand:- start:310 stop:840 length:531 start_codon:yes stop_codon:yes gene_type:complete
MDAVGDDFPIPVGVSNALSTVSAYEKDKRLGTRMVNGTKPLKKLRPVHRKIIGMHLAGFANCEIAEVVSMSQSRISTLLTDPLLLEIIEQGHDAADKELRALTPKAIHVLRTAMDSGDYKHSLRAAEDVLRTQGKFDKVSEEGQTAEDVIQRILKIKSDGPVDVTIGEQRGHRTSR